MVIALVIIVPIRYFVFQPFIVSGSSMEPNFHDGQYLIIDELSYYFRKPERGEVVVMRNPRNEKQYFIKRIIGLPGEKVKLENGRVTIINAKYPQGMTLDEDYLANQGLTYEQDITIVGGNKILTLRSDEYFMLGDNRGASSDSREWGPLPRNEMVGKVFVRALPLTEVKFFTKTPAYGF